MRFMPRPSHETRSAGWARDLCHPLPIGAVLVLAVNDHLLKGAGLLPGWLTGKISDFAGLFFFPLLLTALAAGALHAAGRTGPHDRSRLTAAAAALTAAVFAAIKLSPVANAWASSVWGPMRLDPTDLVALPMAGLGYAWARSRARQAERPIARRFLRLRLGPRGERVLQAAGVIAAALASLATSAPRPPARPDPPPRAAVTPPCARIGLLDCWREGQRMNARVEVVSQGSSHCRVELTAAVELGELTPGRPGVVAQAEELPDPLTLGAGERRTVVLGWLRPAELGGEQFRLEVQGRQWLDGAGAREPDWQGSGALAGICKAPAQVAE